MRLDLHKMIDSVQDRAKLSAIYSFLSKNKDLPDSDWGDAITDELKNQLVKGLEQESENKVINHKKMLDKHRKQFPHLNL